MYFDHKKYLRFSGRPVASQKIQSGEKVFKKGPNDEKSDTFCEPTIERYQKEHHMSSYSDSIRDEITAHFIAALEKGDIPWHRPWNGANTLPHKRPNGIFATRTYPYRHTEG